MLSSAIADIQNGITQADAQLCQGNGPHAGELTAARGAAAWRSKPRKPPVNRSAGGVHPADQSRRRLDRLLAEVAEERDAAERLSRTSIRRCSPRSLGCARCPIHRHPPRKHRPGGPNPTRRSGPAT